MTAAPAGLMALARLGPPKRRGPRGTRRSSCWFQTFFWYERNVTTDTATYATASTSSPSQRTAITLQSG